jgi:YfiH family protein
MIRPPGMPGVAFGTAADGDGRDDCEARLQISTQLGISDRWATVRQVHGRRVVWACGAGDLGEADAVATERPMLPLCVATADCFPVVIQADRAAGIAHAGWRGAAGGIVPALRDAMQRAGAEPRRAAIGPGIGPCCFEVGEEVAAHFGGFESTTDWGTGSVDLPGVLRAQLEGLWLWEAAVCTRCDPTYHSYRRDATRYRQVAVAWLTST